MTRSAHPSSAYDEDFFTWTQDQAAALRRAGEFGEIDIEHLAEEIEDLGKRDLREVSSFLRLLLLHLMKIDASHDASSVAHWRSEAREFRRGAVRAFAPGMRELIDVSTLWREAAERFEEDGRDLKLPSRPLRECPFDLAAILSDAFDLDLALDLMEPVEAAAADGGRRLG